MREVKQRKKIIHEWSRNTLWRRVLQAIRKHKPQTTPHTFQTSDSAGQQKALSTPHPLHKPQYLQQTEHVGQLNQPEQFKSHCLSIVLGTPK